MVTRPGFWLTRLAPGLLGVVDASLITIKTSYRDSRMLVDAPAKWLDAMIEIVIGMATRVLARHRLAEVTSLYGLPIFGRRQQCADIRSWLYFFTLKLIDDADRLFECENTAAYAKQ